MQFRNGKTMYSTTVLKALAAAGSVTTLIARGVQGGFILYIRVGLDEEPVKTYRGQARVFKRLEAVARYVKEIGLDRFETELSGWEEKGLL